ncbi:Isochorismate synthase MenF [Candidatus Lokiarchaeum ossiferum]|uniref:anthranilate synthase n=1 Tax=Candidatus Lokiarchaeum ossiferum TaxID=2951803 RepID=A0ABY6HU40_9ARCH|nr:Isochorismate synthase MenF [Candidatus Lokiarchaeum sp. B-35]
MELNLNIQKIGNTKDIFGFYRYLTSQIDSKNHALLESIDLNSQEMHFSFIGLQPDFMVKVLNNNLKIYDIQTEKGEKMIDMCTDHKFSDLNGVQSFQDEVPVTLPGIDRLKDIFPISNSAMPELFPQKIFSGGLLGYIGYDVVSPYVGYESSDAMQAMFPDIIMGMFTKVLAYSHTTQTIYEVNNTIGANETDPTVSTLFEKFRRSNHTPFSIPTSIDRAAILSQNSSFKTNTSPEQWRNIIEETKEHIYAGDIIQAVLSRKMMAESDVLPIDVYQALRILNPSPYMYYMNFEGAHNGDVRIIGSSPEALITKNQRHLETVPIAGTRRRGRSVDDEIRMANELLHSEKEVAEHIMLVDLARNDLAKVSIPGSIDTYKLLELKKFPNIMHLISRVRSTSNLDPFSILKSMFPAGTVSGAPKRKAMEIIHKLEREDRGPYAGCAGYVNFTGDMDMAISIRTIFNKNKTYVAQAGGGIVADSDPDEEFLETKNKLRGVTATINFVESMS